jgi:hypothetical protein
MKIASVEFREPCALANPSLRTTVLLPESHEWELLENGWLKWRLKGGKWYASPPEMIRNVGLYEEEPTVRISAEVVPMSPEPELILDTVGDRGNPEYEPKPVRRRIKKT